MRENEKASIRPALGLLLLSLLWALGSLRGDLLPQYREPALPPSEREALAFATVTLVALLVALLRKEPWPSGNQFWGSLGVGLGLFVVPSVLVALGQGWISELERVAIFSLTPVLAVVLEPHLQAMGPRQGRGALPAALAAVAGALCLFPLDVPGSPEAGLALGMVILASGCIAVANCLAVRIAHTAPNGSVAPMTALAGMGAAVGFATESLMMRQPVPTGASVIAEVPWILMIDLPALLLLFGLLRRLSATRMTARYLVAPLFTILLGMALERPSIGARFWLGLALLAAGAGWLLFAPEEQPEIRAFLE